MGTTAALQAGDVDIVVTNCKRQTFGPDIFTDLGVDLSAKKAIVVKSAQHYRVMFKEIFAEDIVVDAPGVCPSDVSKLPFKRITRPLWPFDENPFG
jgi:microcystin degradation protein MlrC